MSAAEARLTVDLDALAHNYAALRVAARGAEVAGVVKADGYGLGAAPVARRLRREGARSFFVARVGEGEALREALGGEVDVYVLDGCPPGCADRLARARLAPVLSSREQVAEFAAAARCAAEAWPAAIHVDTGMSRLGLREEEAAALAGDPHALQHLKVELVMSHYACADEPDHPMNRGQADAFAAVRALFPGARASLENSGGVFGAYGAPDDLVRPGISMFGGGPFGTPDARLRPVAILEAPILQVRTVRAGETVGYSANFTAERELRVGVLALGYADGVLRASSPRGAVWFEGARRPILGRVSMDLTAVDLTGCAVGQAGDTAEVFGANLPLDEAAAAAGTIAYELLVRLSPRAERIYVG